jgi:hypothetical protein
MGKGGGAIRRPAKRFSQWMVSSLTNPGKLRLMIYEGALNTTIFQNFLRRLTREAARKLFVIVDNLPIHRARRVTAWVHDRADRIELFYLPPYAPEHNPDEFIEQPDGLFSLFPQPGKTREGRPVSPG